MIDWKKKLTSRKFWAALCSFITNVVVFFNVGEETAVKITALIMAGGSLIAYIIGEGLVDANNAGYIEIDQPPLEEDGKE